MTDLFGTARLAGMASMPDIILASEEAKLVERIESAGLAPFRFQGWLGKRLTMSFGSSYDFDTARLFSARPIPDWLHGLRRQAAEFARLPADDLVQGLLTRYDPGATIGWHRDRPDYEHVVGVSLGAAATMRFRRRAGTKFDRFNAVLAPRSIYHLSGEARHDWEHSIAALAERRWSVTFRSLSAAGLAALARAAPDPR